MSRRFGRNQKRRMREQIAEMQWRHERDEYSAFCLGKHEGYSEARERCQLETEVMRKELQRIYEHVASMKALDSPAIFLIKDDNYVLPKP